MQNRFVKKLILKLFLFLIIIVCSGCGGSGGSSEPSTFSASLAPGTKSYEGGSTVDTLYASVSGPGVAGGWIEDISGNKLPGSDLSLESSTGRYEALIERAAGGIPAGTYILKYFRDGQTFELKKENMQWTTAPAFIPAPTPPDYNPASKLVTVRYQAISGANVRYYLSIYSAVTSNLYRETPYFYGPEISEYIPMSGSYKIVLNAEVLENSLVTATAKHVFSATIQTAKRVP
jgi:hypothetical protein